MAEGRMIKKKLIRSKKWIELDGDDFTRWVYCMLVIGVDNWGMMPADPTTLKANLGPLDKANPDRFGEAVEKLHDMGLVYWWHHQGAPWLYVIGHDIEQARGIRKRGGSPEVPRPDKEIQAWADSHQFPGDSRKVPGVSRNEVEGEVKGEVEVEVNVRFEKFYQPYPKKKNRGDAEKAFKALNPDDALLDRIVKAVETQRRYDPEWKKDGGRYIPYPATWLRAKGWENQIEVEKPQSAAPNIDPKTQWEFQGKVYTKEQMKKIRLSVENDLVNKLPTEMYVMVHRCSDERKEWWE